MILPVKTTAELNKQITEASIETLKQLEEQVEMLKWSVKHAIWKQEKVEQPYREWLRDRESGFCTTCQDRKEDGIKWKQGKYSFILYEGKECPICEVCDSPIKNWENEGFTLCNRCKG